MKFTIKIDLVAAVVVAAICVILLILIFGITREANAQTPDPPGDVALVPIGGLYHIGCQTPLDGDLDQMCFVRTDLPDVIELGCVDAPDPNSIYYMDAPIISTPDDDAEIRCYVIDTGGLVSDYSPNAGIVDFTSPGPPVFIQ